MTTTRPPCWIDRRIRDVRRDATHEASIATRRFHLSADRYSIPTNDIAAVPVAKRKRLKIRSRQGLGGDWNAIINVDELPWADGFIVTKGNDGAAVVLDSSTGRWIQVWGMTARAFGWGPPIPGVRWVGGCVELRRPIVAKGKAVRGPVALDYRFDTANAPEAMGGGIGPLAAGPTRAELDAGGILPRPVPAYVLGPTGGVAPAGKAEADVDVESGVPEGVRWGHPSTEDERVQWANDHGLIGDVRRWLLTLARSMSIDGRGVIAAAAAGPGGDAYWTDWVPELGDYARMVENLPGADRPLCIEAAHGFLDGVDQGTAAGRYDLVDYLPGQLAA